MSKLPRLRLSEIYEPLPTQRAAHDSAAPNVAYIGGWGSGKSIWLGQQSSKWALLRPGTEVLIGRQYATELRDTTQRLFFERVWPEELTENFIKSENRLITKPIGPKRRKSHIIFRQLEDYYKIKSMELGGVGIDEADETSEEAFVWLRSRLRHPLGPNQLYLCANDEGRNWIYHLFHPKGNKHVPGMYELFVANSKENIHLPPGTLENYYRGLPQELVDKYLEPKFQLIGGAIYPEWNPEVHIIDKFKMPDDWPVYRVLDHGLTSPTCCLLFTVSDKNEYVVFDEYYEEGVTVEQAAGAIHMMSSPYKERVEFTIADPAIFRTTHEKHGQLRTVSDEYMEQGIFCIPGNNDVEGGISHVKVLLHNRMIFVTRNCVNTCDEFQDYEWKRTRTAGYKPKPKKTKDHAMDCVRYMASSHAEGPAEPEREQDWWRPVRPQRDRLLAGIPGAYNAFN